MDRIRDKIKPHFAIVAVMAFVMAVILPFAVSLPFAPTLSVYAAGEGSTDMEALKATLHETLKTLKNMQNNGEDNSELAGYIDRAREVLDKSDNGGATVDEIKSEITEINNMISLKYGKDFSGFHEALAVYSQKKSEDYTANTWENLVNAVDSGVEEVQNNSLTVEQTVINDKTVTIKQQIENLKRAGNSTDGSLWMIVAIVTIIASLVVVVMLFIIPIFRGRDFDRDVGSRMGRDTKKETRAEKRQDDGRNRGAYDGADIPSSGVSGFEQQIYDRLDELFVADDDLLQKIRDLAESQSRINRMFDDRLKELESEIQEINRICFNQGNDIKQINETLKSISRGEQTGSGFGYDAPRVEDDENKYEDHRTSLIDTMVREFNDCVKHPSKKEDFIRKYQSKEFGRKSAYGALDMHEATERQFSVVQGGGRMWQLTISGISDEYFIVPLPNYMGSVDQITGSNIFFRYTAKYGDYILIDPAIIEIDFSDNSVNLIKSGHLA